MDEISPIGPTTIIELRGGHVSRWTLDPADCGFTGMRPDELAGGEPSENAALIERVLGNAGPAAAEAAVLLNAAAAIYVAGLTSSFAAALDVAREALRSGAGSAALARLRAAAPHG
jgi:anthranilate phosphoribosyltransferase